MNLRLAANAIANYAGQAVTVLVTFVLTPALLSHLGDEMYGVLMLVSAVQGLGGLFDFGITTSIIKYVAEHRARDEIDQINRVVNTSLLLHLGVGTLAFMVVSGVALFGVPLFSLNGTEQDAARAALILAGVSLLISLPMGAVAGVLPGLRHYEITNAVIVAQTLVTMGVTLYVLQLGAGPAELMLVNTVSLAIAYGVRVFFALRMLPGLRLSPRLADLHTLRRIGGYSVWLFLLDLAKRVFYNADAVLIAAFLPVRNITAYNLGFKPASALTYFSSPFVSVLLPTASSLEAVQDRAQLQRLFVAGTRIAVAITLPVLLWLVLFGGQVLQVWVGPGHEDALPILYVFCAVFLASIVQNPAGTILRGMGQVRRLALLVAGEYAANIVISLMLLPRIGVMGAALGTLIPGLVVDMVLIPALACRALDMKYSSFALGTFGGPLLALLPTALLAWPLRAWMDAPSLPSLAAGGAALTALFVASYLLLGATHTERAMLTELLAGLRGRMRQRQARP